MNNGKVFLTWTGGQQYVGTDSGHHSIVISSHDEQNNTGMRPSELMLLSLGSCSAYDVVSILGKKRIELKSFHVEVDSEQDPEPPWTYRRITLTYQLQGEGLTQKAVDQAIELSLTKYCSVASTLSGKAEIVFEGQILEGQTNPE